MIYLHLPLASSHGWGIVGKYVARELALVRPTRLIADPLDLGKLPDELERHQLDSLICPPDVLSEFLTREGLIRVPGPLLQAIGDKRLLPEFPALKGERTFGYTFFEDNILAPEWIENARRSFDRVVTGSSWCTRVLFEHGLTTAVTAVPGVDRTLFNASAGAAPREFFRDRFVIFSGGKFEFRKGQDVVIRACKVLQERHADVFLVNSWHNAWPRSFATMRRSRLIRFVRQRRCSAAAINRVLADNGIDLDRVLTLSPCAYQALPRIYRNTDVGVFPSRSEGGPNLVLAEYMACGKPAIATATTGQADIVTRHNALIIETGEETLVSDDEGAVGARWPEPDLDSAIERLEWAYQNRDRLARIGARAARDLASCTWKRTAAGLAKLLG